MAIPTVGRIIIPASQFGSKPYLVTQVQIVPIREEAKNYWKPNAEVTGTLVSMKSFGGVHGDFAILGPERHDVFCMMSDGTTNSGMLERFEVLEKYFFVPDGDRWRLISTPQPQA